MTEDYTSFEIAKLLKEKGFDESCTHVCNIESGKILEASFYTCRYVYNSWLDKNEPRLIAAPTLQMAMKWLREVHKLAINIEFQIDFPTWKWRIYHIEPSADKHTNFKHYDTYEEACEAAIKYCLENLI